MQQEEGSSEEAGCLVHPRRAGGAPQEVPPLHALLQQAGHHGRVPARELRHEPQHGAGPGGGRAPRAGAGGRPGGGKPRQRSEGAERLLPLEAPQAAAAGGGRAGGRDHLRPVRGVQPPRHGPAGRTLHRLLQEPHRQPVVLLRRCQHAADLRGGHRHQGRLHPLLPEVEPGGLHLLLGLWLQLLEQLQHGLQPRPLGLQDAGLLLQGQERDQVRPRSQDIGQGGRQEGGEE